MDTGIAADGTHPVIILHGIGEPLRVLEPGEDVFWLSQPQFCDLLDKIVAMGTSGPHITFDDGNLSDIQIALPELENRNLKATFFVLTGRLGQQGSLSEADVITLAQTGHTIGLHGHDHVDWRHLDKDTMAREFIAARAKLTDLVGQPIDSAAAPFGLYNRQTVKDLRASGFTSLYTSDRGLARFSDFVRPRNCLEGGMSVGAMQDMLLGHVRATRRLRRLLGIARKRFLPFRITP